MCIYIYTHIHMYIHIYIYIHTYLGGYVEIVYIERYGDRPVRELGAQAAHLGPSAIDSVFTQTQKV